MEFTVGECVRMGFGFANPNHAAAFLCALMPFCWGWNTRAWLGRVLFVVLFVALALTFSRTGFIVLAVESAAWGLRNRSGRRGIRRTRWYAALVPVLAAAGIWWMAPRLSLDGAIMNRPKIWLEGVRLFLANPWGVGLGNSGLLASSFLLPDGVEVRTLVNSHLTLLAEGGWWCGCAWLVFVGSAVTCGWRMPRVWISFAGLALSACASSVFDWHVLFLGDGMARYGLLNAVLSWGLLAVFLILGLMLLVRGFRPFRVLGVAGGVSVVTGTLLLVCPTEGMPRVLSGYVHYGKDGPTVLHDGGWDLKVIRGYLPDGAVVRLREGAENPLPWPARTVWLFGDVAESSDRFPGAEVTVVGAPEFYVPGLNVGKVIPEEE